MDKPKFAYYIQVPLHGATPEQMGLGTGWYTIARAETPEGAGAVVAALCGNPDVATMQLRVEIRREL